MNSVESFYPKTFIIHLKKPVLDAYWLAGFFEGNGCLNIAYPTPKQFILSFVLCQADPKVLYKVKSFLGFGSIDCHPKGYWTYSIRNKEGLLKVATLLNGKLVFTKHLEQYESWVKALNKKYNTSLVVIKKPAMLSWKNSWFTGFADAEGSFNILLNKGPDNQPYRLRLRFYVDQAHSLESMKNLQAWLGGTLHAKTKNQLCYQRLMLDTFHKSPKLIDYFSHFPPLTTWLMVRFIRYARVYRWYLLKQWKDRLKEIQHLIQLNKKLIKKPLVLKKVQTFTYNSSE